ncbi:MAG: hypothetical protein MR954_06730 [Lachnobacterium sp.]|nr:hypothetical protein [Lachnobacterium sp.]
MSVLLLILKIIGIILLVILALFVLLIVGILFVPYAYRVKGSFHGKPDLTASIYGLGHLVGIGMILTENGAKIYLRICGIRKFLQSGNKENKTGNTDQYEENMGEGQKTDPETGNYENLPMPEMQKIKAFWQKIVKIPEKFKRVIARIRDFFHTIKSAFGNVKKTIRKVKCLLTNESHKSAFTKLKTSVWQLLKILMPYRLKLNLEYSTGSPDTTAQLLGILTMFPIGYQNRWNVHPDFTADNAYAEAEFDVKGRILGFSLLKLILGLVLDKDCRKLYNHFKTMKA